jgi:hypothetical protein
MEKFSATIVGNLQLQSPMLSTPITLEQIILAVRQLEPDGQAQVAQALLQVGLRSDLSVLIQELYAQPAADDIADDAILAEVKAVRQYAG